LSQLFRQEAVAYATRRLDGAVVLASPLSVKLLSGLLAGAILCAATFSATASYARKANVSGWLVPDLGLIKATAQAPGFVKRLLVSEGQIIEQGERIAEISLSSETSMGNTGDRTQRSIAAEAEAIKTRSEAQVAKPVAEQAQAQRRIKGLAGELAQAKAQVKLQEERLRLAQELVTRSEGLAARGYMARKDLEARISAALAAEQELTQHHRQVAAVERELVDLDGRLKAIPIEIAAANAERQAAEASLQQRSIDTESRRRQFITAPIAGRVAALPVAAGQSVPAGATIAIMTPTGGRLEAELLTPSRAIGFIRKDQDVRLMLQAFPFQRFGAVTGKVRSISSTVLGPTEISIPGINVQEPVFRVRVALDRESISAYDETISLQPGMLLSADVVFDRRSLLQWLFDPIYAVRGRS
jgi:membrane fusion protein